MFGSIQIGSIDPGSGTLTIRNWTAGLMQMKRGHTLVLMLQHIHLQLMRM
jgi:hypothetical protein